MKLPRPLLIGLGTLAVLGAGLWFGKGYILLHIGGWMGPRPGPNHPVAWAQGPATAALSPDKRPPNIVLILADDMGFNDITAHGGGVAGGTVPTPNINSIGQEGVTLTNGYAGNGTCAPSRAAIMTGRYPTRFGFEFTPTPPAFSQLVGTFESPDTLHKSIFYKDRVKDSPSMDRMGIPSTETTIAEILKTRGYHTVHLGKWHLGAAAGMRPEQRGFDESLGFLAGASMFLPANDPNVVNSKQDFDPIDRFLWANLPYGVQWNGSKYFKPKGYMTDYLTDEAISAIRANRNQPFFIYLAYNAIHTPLQATRADYDALPQIKDHRLRVYGAMVRNLDRNVGRVMAELKAQGLDDNTLVIFTSDNGGANYIGLPEINRPYRGWKATFFEGGIHVPYFMRWPAGLPAKSTYNAPVGHIDIFATAAAAAGAALPTGRIIDGVNLRPFLNGKDAQQPHKTLFWRSGDYKVVLAEGWKLQVSARPQKDWLFDMKADPTEAHNLADTRPDKVRALKALLAAQDRASVKPLWPSLVEGAFAIDHTLGVPNKASDEYVYWAN
jgi:arylsulfatase A-like enzyme